MKQLFFVKPPVAGSVKTRLARFTGPELANEIYKSILSEVLNFKLNSNRLRFTTDAVYSNPCKFIRRHFSKVPTSPLV